MTERAEALIGDLSANLAPVRRLWPPMVRAGLWLACAAVTGVAVTSRASLETAWVRFTMLPDLGWTLGGAALTAMLAAVAAFELSLPDRKSAWAWLPVPAIVLWLTASGWGCLRDYGLPGLDPATVQDGIGCVGTILGVSIPLSLLLLALLRPARPLRPGLVAFTGGLAASAASVTVLCLIHPHDASAIDLLMHLAAIATVITAVRRWGGRVLSTPSFAVRGRGSG